MRSSIVAIERFPWISKACDDRSAKASILDVSIQAAVANGRSGSLMQGADADKKTCGPGGVDRPANPNVRKL
ncbi:MAG TPA: hypothetical protein DHW22_09150 [Planctomycetaceae bacterium]|nr:hypothetical protein [Planctomycetaceae bacterium]